MNFTPKRCEAPYVPRQHPLEQAHRPRLRRSRDNAHAVSRLPRSRPLAFVTFMPRTRACVFFTVARSTVYRGIQLADSTARAPTSERPYLWASAPVKRRKRFASAGVHGRRGLSAGRHASRLARGRPETSACCRFWGRSPALTTRQQAVDQRVRGRPALSWCSRRRRGDVMVDGVSRARAVRPLDLSGPLDTTAAPAAGVLGELAADGHRWERRATRPSARVSVTSCKVAAPKQR